MAEISREQIIYLWGLMCENIEVNYKEGGHGSGRDHTLSIEVRRGNKFSMILWNNYDEYSIRSDFGRIELSKEEWDDCLKKALFRSGSITKEYDYITAFLLRK